MGSGSAAVIESMPASHRPVYYPLWAADWQMQSCRRPWIAMPRETASTVGKKVAQNHESRGHPPAVVIGGVAQQVNLLDVCQSL